MRLKEFFTIIWSLITEWLKVLADSGININSGSGGENALLGWASSLHQMSQLFTIFYHWVRISIAQLMMVMIALMLLIKCHGDAAYETAK